MSNHVENTPPPGQQRVTYADMWFRVDDQFANHPKLMRIPARHRNDAAGLWLRVGCWCSVYLTDGRIDDTVPAQYDGTKTAVARLVDAGLWLPAAGGGWQMHDWEAWQPTRFQIEERRTAEARRKRIERRLHGKGDTGDDEL